MTSRERLPWQLEDAGQGLLEANPFDGRPRALREAQERAAARRRELIETSDPQSADLQNFETKD